MVASGTPARTHTEDIYTLTKKGMMIPHSPLEVYIDIWIKFYFLFAKNHSIFFTIMLLQSIIFNTKENTKHCEIKPYSITQHIHVHIDTRAWPYT
jgi:hypothetical protein